MPLWIWDDNEKEGDFCNVDSQHEYQNGNVTDAVLAAAEALAAGEEGIWGDEPIDSNEPVEVEPGQHFSRWNSSIDSQGVDYPKENA